MQSNRSIDLRAVRAAIERDFFAAGVRGVALRLLASRFRLLPIEALNEALPREGKILEIGCGQGVMAHVFARLAPGRTIAGCDCAAGRIAVALAAARVAALPNLTFTIGDACCLPFAAGSFDAASMIEVLYLVPYEQQVNVLKEAARVLRPGGRLVLCEPAKDRSFGSRYHRWQSFVLTHLAQLPGGSTLFGQRQRGSPFLRTHGELVDLLVQADFTVVQTVRVRRAIYPHAFIVGQRHS